MPSSDGHEVDSDDRHEVDADLWGRVMLDYHLGLRATYGIRRDDGYLDDEHSPEVYFADWERYFPWETELLDLVQSPVLDIGAGPGRMALWAQTQGHQVVAIESSPLTALVATERGVEDARLGRWEEFDTSLLADECSFGTVLLMGHNLGLGGTLDGLRTLLRTAGERARRGATLLGTSLEFSDTVDPVHLRYQERQRRAEHYPGELRIRIEYDGRIGPYFPWLLVGSEELLRLGQETGWFVERLIRGDEGSYGVVLRKIM